MPRKTICIIDDDPIYQLVTQRMIQKSELFAETTPFSTAVEAIEHFRVAKLFPDVILLDIEMPHLDAWDFLKEITPLLNASHKTYQIHIVSSSIAVEDRKRAESFLHVTSFISKPIDLAKLKQIADL